MWTEARTCSPIRSPEDRPPSAARGILPSRCTADHFFGARKNSQGVGWTSTCTDAAILISPRRLAGEAGPGDGPNLTPAFCRGCQIDAASPARKPPFPLGRHARRGARANASRRLADLLEEHRIELMACLRQGGPQDDSRCAGRGPRGCLISAATMRRNACADAGLQPVMPLPGPTGERNELRLEGRVASGSPSRRGISRSRSSWGKCAAALVTGNTVVAKPAPQTPRIAARAVELAL